ncbi:MAG: hypothetical protein KDF63_03885, partial [Rhodoferax sp.]|nr:hypothetical protein [Rhodoferax sp.]
VSSVVATFVKHVKRLHAEESGQLPDLGSIPISGIEPLSAPAAVRRKERPIAARSASNNLNARRM